MAFRVFNSTVAQTAASGATKDGYVQLQLQHWTKSFRFFDDAKRMRRSLPERPLPAPHDGAGTPILIRVPSFSRFAGLALRRPDDGRER
jgi:hypothetical protein